MTRLALELSLPAVAAWKGGGVAGGAAGAMLQNETNGLAFNASDDSIVIKDTTTPANNYAGSCIAKFGAVRASAGLYYDVNGILQSSANGLRRDYDPRVTGPKYLVEEQRTNLVLWSEAADNAYWSKSNCTITANAVTAPDGNLTADAMIPSAGSVSCQINVNGTTVASGAAYTLSRYVKNGTLGTNWIEITSVSPGGIRTFFNLATGVKGTSIGSPTSYNIVALPNGWYRVDMTITTGAVYCDFYISPRPADGNPGPITGDGVSPAFYTWGAMLEAGAAASSYIPTTTATVTRAVDLPLLPTSAFPTNTTLVTIYTEVNFGTTAPTGRGMIGVGAFGGAGTINMCQTAGINDGQILITPDSYTDVIMSLADGPFSLARNKLAAAAEVTAPNAVIVRNNGALSTQTTGGPFGPMNYTGKSLIMGARDVSAGLSLNGWVLAGMFLPRRMTNAEVGVLTTL